MPSQQDLRFLSRYMPCLVLSKEQVWRASFRGNLTETRSGSTNPRNLPKSSCQDTSTKRNTNPFLSGSCASTASNESQTNSTDFGAYRHELFQRGQSQLCLQMARQKINGISNNTKANPKDSRRPFYIYLGELISRST